MSRNGTRGLQRIVVEYNTSTGEGSAGLRHAFAREIPAFQAKFPDVAIEIRRRSKPQPWVTGFYRDGSERVYNIQDLSAQAIAIKLYRLVNDFNEPAVHFRNVHLHRQRPSAQGNWNPYLWMAERNESRVDRGNWDRQLSEEEWTFYVDKFSDDMEQHERGVAALLNERTDLPNRHTEEVRQRWSEHVAPTLQTDVEENISHFKKIAAQGKLPEPVKFGEYDLFSMPDQFQMGTDAIAAIRTRESQALEKWWQGKREQLKAPW